MNKLLLVLLGLLAKLTTSKENLSRLIKQEEQQLHNNRKLLQSEQKTYGIRRFYNSKTGDHFYVKNGETPLGSDYVDQGIVFYTLEAQEDDAVLLYRYLRNYDIYVDHFYTTQFNEIRTITLGAQGALDYRFEGNIGYCFPAKKDNTVPLHRYARTAGGIDHFYTTNKLEIGDGKVAGYVYERIECYVYSEGQLDINQCKAIDYDIADKFEEQLKTGEVSSDSILPITYINKATQDATIATFSKEKCEKELTTFEYTTGSKISFGFTLGFKVSADVWVAKTELSAEMNLESEFSSEFKETTTKETTICTTIPSNDYKCPPRSVCKREFITLKPSTNSFPITIISECNDGKKYTTEGKITTNGYMGIQAKDSVIPLDCIWYTTDGYDRQNGKLFACDTCHFNATETNLCDNCRDGQVLLDGQCISDKNCVIDCGGVVEGSGINENGIGDNHTPWSGAYCRIENEIIHSSTSCKSILGLSN